MSSTADTYGMLALSTCLTTFIEHALSFWILKALATAYITCPKSFFPGQGHVICYIWSLKRASSLLVSERRTEQLQRQIQKMLCCDIA